MRFILIQRDMCGTFGLGSFRLVYVLILALGVVCFWLTWGWVVDRPWSAGGGEPKVHII